MPPLRYKDRSTDRSRDRDKDRGKDRGRDHKKRSKKKKRHHDRPKYYTPPVVYDDDYTFDFQQAEKRDETEWNERLFSAMMDDEGQDPFYTMYEESHGNNPHTMTDEEYRQYIQEQMYRKKHAAEIALQEELERKAEKRRREKAEARARAEEHERERLRQEAIVRQLEKQRRRGCTREEYEEKWRLIETATSVTKKDIPWPITAVFAVEGVREFLIDPSQPREINRKAVRKEQLRYHPDKFTHRVLSKFKGSSKEKERLISKINEVAGWLNTLWSELN